MRYLLVLPLALTVGSPIAPFVSHQTQSTLVVHMTQGAGMATVPLQKTEMYLGPPFAFVAPVKAALTATELTYGIRAWKEGDKARVVVYAILNDKRTPSGRTETPISTFLIGPKESLEVKEAHSWGSTGLVVSAEIR